jgi:hypothetical protein
MKQSTFPTWLGLPVLVLGTGLAAQGCTADTSPPPPTGSSASSLAAPEPGHSGASSGGIDPFGGSDGGSAESGASEGGADSGYAYSFLSGKDLDQIILIALALGLTESIPFTWHDAAGLAPPADLWVEAGGKPLVQVSSVNGAPFAHMGLDIVPLVADTKYDLVFSRVDDSVDVSIVDASGTVLLQTQTGAGVSVANLVLPGTMWRQAVVLP